MNTNVPSLTPYQTSPVAQQVTNELRWVQGKTAAQAYPLMPGTSGIFMDTDASKFYVKTVGFNGVPTPIREFDYQEVTAQPATVEVTNLDDKYVSKEEFDKVLTKLNDISEKLERKNNYKKGGYNRNE